MQVATSLNSMELPNQALYTAWTSKQLSLTLVTIFPSAGHNAHATFIAVDLMKLFVPNIEPFGSRLAIISIHRLFHGLSADRPEILRQQSDSRSTRSSRSTTLKASTGSGRAATDTSPSPVALEEPVFDGRDQDNGHSSGNSKGRPKEKRKSEAVVREERKKTLELALGK